jgi:hypothetical protein
MLAFVAPELAAPDLARVRRVAALASELAADRLGVPDVLPALAGPAAPAAVPDVMARLTQLEQENRALAARLLKLERG